MEHYPRGYVDLTGELTVAAAEDNTQCAVRALVTSKSPVKAIRRGLTVAKIRATDYESELLITFFNAKYTVDALEINKEYIFYGEISKKRNGNAEMNSPTVFPAEEKRWYWKETQRPGRPYFTGLRSICTVTCRNRRILQESALTCLGQ